MNKVDTYNRVDELERKGAKKVLLFFSSLFLSLCIVGITLLYFLDSSKSLLLAGSSISLLLSILMFSFALRKKPKCRYCGKKLEFIKRDFQFQNNHLFGRGLLIDDEVFMPSSWGYIPFRRKWRKLCHWSLTCHNCRIFENTYHETSIPVSDHEMEKIERHEKKSQINSNLV